MSVDFEAANQLARGFWLQHFQPICHSLLRKVDERILWGRPTRRRIGSGGIPIRPRRIIHPGYLEV